VSLEDDVRRVVIEGEKALREVRDQRSQKEALLPQYHLYLRVLSRSTLPKVVRAESYLRVVGAARDPIALANLEDTPDFDNPSIESLAGSPLLALAAYMERLSDTTVLLIETGANVLTLFTLSSGDAPLEERIALEQAGKSFVDALVNLIRQQQDDIDRIERREPITPGFSDAIEAAAAAVWSTMPPPIREAISRARTLLYLPSAFGDLGAFPLELVRGEQGWLGTTHSIARLTSLRTLFELLSPNRMPSQPSNEALIVRARDADDLTATDGEVDAVSEKLTALNLEVRVDRAPAVASFSAALDAGFRTLHYCGHGFAGRLGESLPLTADEMLGPQDFSQLSGSKTPFVYLSTCEVGRSRMTSTGSAAGISTRLIEKGAPGVVGCLQPVPDLVARTMADSFYGAAASHSAGEALTAARAAQKRFPAATWGAFVYFGDPNLKIREPSSPLSQTRSLTSRWDSCVGRHLAIRSPESRQRAIDALAEAREKQAGSQALTAVVDWLTTSFQANEPEVMEARLALCREVAREDVVAGCELRMLLAMEAMQGSYYGDRKPDIVFAPEEVAVGLSCARAVHDTIAWPAFAVECARAGAIGYEPTAVLHMLGEAAGMLEGWLVEEPEVAALLSTAQELRSALMRNHGDF
jgi:CHAT domain-containing protein